MRRARARNVSEPEEVSLNLNSMMDLFAVLIPALLMMSAVVEVCALNVVAPSTNTTHVAPPPHDKPPFTLNVAISAQGYTITGTGAEPLGTAPGTPLLLPLVQRKISCGRWRGSRPPPRTRNSEVDKCAHPGDIREFWLYDVQSLGKKMAEIKDGYPDERRIVIQAEPHVEYESVIDVMDATRDIREPDGNTRVLFDEVVLSPT